MWRLPFSPLIVAYIFLKIVSQRCGSYSEEKQLPECRAVLSTSAVHMMLSVRGLQELGRREHVPLCLCFANLQKKYDSVNNTLLWAVLARFGMPPQIDIRRPSVSQRNARLCAAYRRHRFQLIRVRVDRAMAGNNPQAKTLWSMRCAEQRYGTVCQVRDGFGLTVSAKKTEVMLLRPPSTPTQKYLSSRRRTRATRADRTVCLPWGHN